MLNPDRELRMDIKDFLDHPWGQGKIIEKFPPVGPHFKRNVVRNISKISEMTIDEVTDKIEKQPYGQLGGTFNIELHKHQLDLIRLKRSPVISHISSINLSQINTFSLRVN